MRAGLDYVSCSPFRVPLARTTRYMMVDPRIAEQVWSWAREGDGVAAIAGKLVASAR